MRRCDTASADPFQDGVASANRGDYATAGMTKAEKNLRALYPHGFGVTRNDDQAVKWYQAAADQGLTDGENHLGWVSGSPKTWPRLKRYQAAADQGNERAQFNLGLFQKIAPAYRWT